MFLAASLNKDQESPDSPPFRRKHHLMCLPLGTRMKEKTVDEQKGITKAYGKGIWLLPG